MVSRTWRVASAVLGIFMGIWVGIYTIPAFQTLTGLSLGAWQRIGYVALVSLVLGGFFALIVPTVVSLVLRLTARVEAWLSATPLQDIWSGAFGLIVGLLIAALLSIALSKIPGVGAYLPTAASMVFGYLGLVVGLKKRDDLVAMWAARFKSRERPERPQAAGSPSSPGHAGAVPKVLDTSTIIDGRIADICKTGFLEGPLLLPSFVLEELGRIADSSDALKRNRGRRGLDVLNRLQKDPNVPIQIYDKDPAPGLDVDAKLVRLAKMLNAKVLTNDFNLNKIAELQGVAVLNINELANAIKPVVLPGEEMVVHVIKDGKESGQGVGYLDDGTMIVVDGGKRHIGETIGVLVTSVLQTAAGRMIFARPKSNAERAIS